MPQFVVIYKPSAERALRALPTAVQRRIAAATDALRDDPRPHSCVKLAGPEELWRIRVGRYRVVYTIRDEELTVLVLRVAHRKDVYRGM